MGFRDTQNPGIGGLDELTTAEELLVQGISGLGDPNADRILFWDDSAGGYRHLTLGANLSITGTTLDSNAGGGGGGTVTSVSVTTANGVSGSVATSTTTPAITLTLGAITPTTVVASGNVTGANLSGTNTGDQTITLTGDVTGSGTGSFAATIASGSVTNAKQANMATSTIKGRVSGGSGSPEDLTGTQATTLLDTFTSALKGLVPASGGGTTTYLRADGSWATPSGGGGGTGITWNEVTSTTQTGSVNNGYILNNVSLVTFTIPSTAAVGDIIEVVGKGAGGWRISINASEVIHFGNQDTTTGTSGYLASTNRYDSVKLVCIVANTEWVVASSVGNITVN